MAQNGSMATAAQCRARMIRQEQPENNVTKRTRRRGRSRPVQVSISEKRAVLPVR
jgi:hypothetical protein